MSSKTMFAPAPHSGSRIKKEQDSWLTLLDSLERLFPSLKRYLSWDAAIEAAGPVFYVPELSGTGARDVVRTVPAHYVPASAASAAWDAVQVSYRGAYSVERLYAFDEYCSHASLLRVLLVCSVAPLPPLVLVLLIECVPLQSPALGWHANNVFFGRSWVCAFVVAMATLLQVKNIFPDLALTTRECTTVSLATAVVSTSTILLLASVWAFPVPLSLALAIVPFGLLFIAIAVIMIGPQRIARLHDARNRLRRFAVLVAIQGSLPLLYPAFATLYAQLTSPSAHVACICALPLIKQLLKSVLVRHATTTVHDYVPEIVVFSIDAFHSIYLCACMEVTASPYTKAIVIALDLVHHVLSCAGLCARTTLVRQLVALPAPIFQGRALSAIMVDLFAHPNCLDARAFASVRLRSCLHHRISRQASRVIRRLSIAHPSGMLKEDDDLEPEGCRDVVTATPSSLLPMPLVLRRQSTDDLLVLADVMRPTATKKPSSGRGRRPGSARILRIKSRRSVSSTRSTERSGSSFSLGPLSSTGATRSKAPPPPTRSGTLAWSIASTSASSSSKVQPTGATPRSSSSGRHASLVEAAKRHHRVHVFDAMQSPVKTQLAHESLALFFTTEYLALTEYVELIVPLLYCVYVPVLSRLPNFQFHPLLFAALGSARSHDTSGNDSSALAAATLNVGTYAAMEIATFVLLHVVLRKRLRVSPLYQVAFVLENQIEMIEGKLLAWMLFAVQYPLAHSGGIGAYGGA